jgi:hypothetical protein
MAAYAIAPDVIAAHLEGEAVLLNLGDKRYYHLNETAACVWQAIERGADNDTIVSALRERFDVDLALAADAVATILADFARLRLTVAAPAR